MYKGENYSVNPVSIVNNISDLYKLIGGELFNLFKLIFKLTKPYKIRFKSLLRAINPTFLYKLLTSVLSPFLLPSAQNISFIS